MSQSIEQQNLRFFNLWSGFYEQGPVFWWLHSMQKKVLKQILLSKNSVVLDVGCGTGRGLLFMRERGFKKLFGIDLSPKMIARSKNLLENNAVLKVASVEKLPFDKNKFDVVTNTEAFHHFPNPHSAVAEIHRVIKPGGMFYLADINFFSRTIHWLFKKLEPGHVKIYSKKEFAELFAQAGFKVVEQKRVSLFVILTVGKKII